MGRKIFMASFFLLLLSMLSISALNAAEPLRVMVIGAHPDDCEFNAGGIAVLFTQMGHQVKFVSLANGNKGHHLMKPADIAERRAKESKEVARILGVEYEIMDNNDGEVMATLENRFAVIKQICDWKADIVITHRPNDYHADHRNTSIIVQDAAFMVAVPLMAPESEALRKPVVFLYMPDNFKKPTPFSPDIVIDITAVAEKKADALCANTSQLYEWLPWVGGWEKDLPADRSQWRQFVGDRYLHLRNRVDRFGDAPVLQWYSPEQLKNIRYTEAFEICEYGYMPDKEDIKRLFPMLP